jgi:xylose isomerase
MEFFPEIPIIKYEGKKSKNPLSFKQYDADKVIAGKTMREHLRFAMAWWHTMVADGTDMFGVGTMDKKFGAVSDMAVAKKRVPAAFELMQKLGIGYFCFHDKDLAPEGADLASFHKNLDAVVPLVKEEMDKTGIKCLWGTANLFSNPRYAHGAGTSCDANIFAYAAAQIKKAIDITVAFGGEGYVFWGGREGYDTLLNTDMGLELDNLARLLTLSRDYGRANGFNGCFYIEPKPKEPTKHQYDFDASTVLAFLRKYNLTSDFKLNIEANHATLSQHTFQHELVVARINDALGSIDANQGDPNLGWDTDQFPTNVYDTTLAMLEVLKAGGFTTGGLNFDAKCRRPSMTHEDIFLSFIAGMDSFAFGLKAADAIRKDGRICDFVKDRYSSYESGIGKKIVSGDTSLEELYKYALDLGEYNSVGSGRQEYLEDIFNQVMLAAD